ncbi:MAG TPA: WecB/TagA/CpsF family glycosyltransferase [Acidimicrobiales bacterium]
MSALTTLATAPPRPPTRRLFGLDFIDDVGVEATVERVLGPQAGDGREPIVFTPNVDILVHLGDLEPRGAARRLRNARYVLPDGQPIVWASRLLDRPLRARLPGSDLVPPLWRRIVADGRRALVVASCEDVTAALRAEHPTLAAYVPPVFDPGDPDALAAVVGATARLLDRAEPEFVFLGVSFAKAHALAFALIDHLRREGRPLPVFLLIGGSFDMYVGRTPRAPVWMQRVGAEWFHRFLLEPRRLFRRYFVEDVRFLAVLAREVRATRTARPASIAPGPARGPRRRPRWLPGAVPSD